MKKAIIATVSGTILLFTSSIASAQTCILGIFVAAAYVSAHENRELTSKEAFSCGLSRLFDKPEEKSEKKPKKKKKVAQQAKQH